MTAASPSAPARRDRTPATLQVVSREQLSTHTVRLVLGGAGYGDVRDNDFTDKYGKLMFTDPDGDTVTRTYTIRRSDPTRRELTLDFVVHGDHGLAAPWARTAAAGDVVTLRGAGGAYRPSPEHEAFLFVGDESALPAINAALEVLPAGARATVVVESSDPAQALDHDPAAAVELRVLPRETPGSQPELLAGVVAQLPWPQAPVDVFAHGERESMKAVRAALKPRLRDGDRLSISGYWAAGRTEDRFQAEKREPIGRID